MAKHRASINTNKQIHDISQSEPEQDSSGRGAPRIACGPPKPSSWLSSSGRCAESSSSPSIKSSRTMPFVPAVSFCANSEFNIMSLILSGPAADAIVTDATINFSSSVWLLVNSGVCDALLLFWKFFGLFWPLVWTVGRSSLVFSRIEYAFAGTFIVFRACISTSLSILFKRLMSDIWNVNGTNVKWLIGLAWSRAHNYNLLTVQLQRSAIACSVSPSCICASNTFSRRRCVCNGTLLSNSSSSFCTSR